MQPTLNDGGEKGLDRYSPSSHEKRGTLEGVLPTATRERKREREDQTITYIPRMDDDCRHSKRRKKANKHSRWPSPVASWKKTNGVSWEKQTRAITDTARKSRKKIQTRL